MSFNLFFSLFNNIFHLSVYVVVALSNLNQPKLIFFPLVKPSLNFIC